MRNRIRLLNLCVIAALNMSVMDVRVGYAQEKSVRPGINDAFRDPNAKVEDWVERFEGESREVFDKRNRIVAALQLRPGMSIADVGAGTGLFTRLFAHEVETKGAVYAVDISPKLIEYVKNSAEKLQLPQVKTVLGKDDSPELPASSVDLVFICDTYHHFEFPEKMMRSIHRALKPGGRVAIIDFIREPGVSSEWVLEHVRAGQDVVEQEVSACGFRKAKDIKEVLTENYFVIFEKVETLPKPRQEPD